MTQSTCQLCSEEKEKEDIVIFDLYGTLVDWRYSISRFIEFYISPKAIEDFFKCDIEQVPREYRPYKRILKECLIDTARKHHIVLSEDLASSFIITFAKSPPYPDVVYGLKLIRNQGYRTCILSNTDRDLVEITLYGIHDLFDHVVTAEDVKAYKPRLEAFTRAYEILGIKPENAIHVSAYPEYDLVPASTLGAKTILVDRGLRYKWHLVAKNLVELLAVIDYLKN